MNEPASTAAATPTAPDGHEPALVRCVAYRDGAKLADIGAHEISRYRREPGTFIWVALRHADEGVLAELQQQFGLHSLAVEDACHGHQRPKIEEFGDSLFVVLMLLERHEDELRTGEVAIFVGHDYVVSVRTGVEQGFQAVRTRCEGEPTLLRNGPAYVLYALMDAVVDRYFPVLDALEGELEQVEERIFAANGSARDNIEALYSLKQQLMSVKHAVTPMLEASSNLAGARVPALVAAMRDYYRDIYDHLQRLNLTVETTRETITTAISVNLSMITLQESETMKRLAAYAALIAVPTLVAGVYGMNFDHMPELHWRWGYEAIMAGMIALDSYLFWRFRRARWL
jgi:magnesium transporter